MSAQASNVVRFLAEAAASFGSRQALVIEVPDDDAQGVTFAELWDRVDRLSVGLRRLGLSPGERAIIMIPMSIDLYVAMLAVMKLGAAAVFVDPWIGRRQIAAFAGFASPAAYIGIGKSHLLRLLDGRLRSIRLSVTTGRRFWRLPARWTLKELGDRPGDGEVHAAGSDDPALITFTSGASGIPKGTNRTHGFLSAQHLALREEFPYRDDDVDMPMFPVFALNNLASGITSIVPRMDFRNVAGVDGGVIADQMRRHDVTTCTASPPFFDRMIDAAEHDQIPQIRRILTGGAPVTDEQLRRWRRAWPETEIVVAYGSTEAEPVAKIDAARRLEAESDVYPHAPGFCVGKPSRLVDAKLIRIHREPVALREGDWSPWLVGPSEIGELVVAGCHVGKDYYRNPAAVAENKIAEPDGAIWHRMGDTGYFDGDGRFWLVGRVHSTIWRAGQPVHPQLVEQAARGDDNRITQAAAVGEAAPRMGQRVVVVVVVAAEHETAVRNEVEARLQQANQPWDEMILTQITLPVDPRHNSKIEYTRLGRMLAEIRLSRHSSTCSRK